MSEHQSENYFDPASGEPSWLVQEKIERAAYDEDVQRAVYAFHAAKTQPLNPDVHSEEREALLDRQNMALDAVILEYKLRPEHRERVLEEAKSYIEES